MTARSGVSTLTTHVLDTMLGRPARGIGVTLERLGDDGDITKLGAAVTDTDGRVRDLVGPIEALSTGTYRLRFDTGNYFAAAKRETLYPEIVIVFRVAGVAQHYHVPLLLSPFGYTTYRGS